MVKKSRARSAPPGFAPPKYATRRTPRRRNRAAEIMATSVAMGTPLMPWQYSVAEVATEYRVATRVPYRKTVTVTVPRQSGKSVLVQSVGVNTLMADPYLYAVYVAQTRLGATNRLRDIAHRLESLGVDPGHKFTRGVGNEKITFTNGSRLEVQSPKAVSAHGESIDLAILDELWRVPSDVMSGVVPAMVARPRAQLWLLSTAGNEESELLNNMVAKGREDPDGDMAFFEWSMPEDANVYDSARWHEWMPALGHTASIESIAAAQSVMSLPEFRRAFGNIAILEDNAAAIPEAWWRWGHTTEEVPPVGLSLAVDVNRTPPGWSIAAAWPTSEGFHGDLVEHGIGLELSPIPAKLRELVARFRPAEICLDPTGPAGALVPDIQSIADDYVIPLRTFNGAQRARADVWLFDLLRGSTEEHTEEADATAPTFTHSPMIPLDQAAEAARAEEKGAAWFFSRATSYVDLSPLLAVSMAVWSARECEVLAPVYLIG